MFDVETLVSDFVESAWTARLVGWPCGLTTERLPAPHRQPQLKSGNGAVYTFSLSHSYGASVPAGPGRVLKVGKVGAKSGPRFYSQHYTLSAPSTLAKSLLRHRILWPWLGVTALDATNVRDWMLTNLDRTHFFVPDGRPEVLAALEVFVRARVGSAFEGA
ncbi:MAG TPA: hypothetical protein VGR26_19205 [Acidimicrobiales bacterium]|nr:hypothetical protein [Acidimicrobiales bacterium]